MCEVYLALAALGGHLDRTGDSPSGWQILWIGRLSLSLLVEEVNMGANYLISKARRSADLPAGAS